jgi:type II secretory pathway pseudopilin PulG
MGTSRLDNGGFTYMTALMLVMVMGIMLGITGQSWKTIMQREREEELLFRGSQYKDAISHWYTPRMGEHEVTPLRSLEDLVKDPRMTGTVRYLRRLYPDPMTGKAWDVIGGAGGTAGGTGATGATGATAAPGGTISLGVPGTFGGIVGVASTSTEQPFKTGNFPDDLLELAGKNRYCDWKFSYTGQQGTGGTADLATAPGSGLTNSMPGAGSPTGPGTGLTGLIPGGGAVTGPGAGFPGLMPGGGASPR